MKKLFNSMMAIAIAACTFTSCEDVPEPYNNPYSYTPAETIAPKGTGTQADPFNVAAALAKCQEVGETGTTEDVYAEGYVVSIKSIDVAQYNNAEFSIADSKEGGDMLTVYRAKGPGNQPITDANIIKNGDKVLICGKLVNYKGNTPEFTQGCYIVSVNGEGGDPTPGPQPTPTGDNLLQNGDFESWTDGVPTNWKTTSSAGNATLSQSSNARGGSYSVSVGFNATKNLRLGYKETTLKAGTYTFSFYAKSTTAEKSQSQAGYVIVNDGTPGTYKYGGYVSLSNTEWTLVSTTFTLDAQSVVSLVAMNPKSSDYATAQDILIDDASLTTTDGGIADGGGDAPTPTGDAYTKVTTITNGKYIIAANTTGDAYVVATPLADTKTYGYLNKEDVTAQGEAITTEAANEFTFTAISGGYTIQDASGRYLYMTGTYNSFNVDTTVPAEGHIWTVSFDNGNVAIKNASTGKTIQYSAQYSSYGAYTDVTNTLPFLFKK